MTTAKSPGFRRRRKTLFTAEELLRLPADGRRLELVKGKVYEMAPAGGEHGEVAGTALILLGSHIRNNRLGRVYAAETGFMLARDPDTVRAPDVAFVSTERLPEGRSPRSYPELAPDLAVEVISPNDRMREVLDKVANWLESGTRMVWLIDPIRRTVTVFRLGREPLTAYPGGHPGWGGRAAGIQLLRRGTLRLESPRRATLSFA